MSKYYFSYDIILAWNPQMWNKYTRFINLLWGFDRSK